ncbi:MAG: hypothetical protein J0H31_10140, partial [Alphaproteobacteria bacterium]|nr:hypothetical protein [Alphaproteobacteria bacterium]
MRGVAQLERDGKVESGRSAAENRNLHVLRSPLGQLQEKRATALHPELRETLQGHPEPPDGPAAPTLSIAPGDNYFKLKVL